MNTNEFVENDNESDYESIIDEESTIDLLNNNKIKKINLNELKLFICNNLSEFCNNIEEYKHNNILNIEHINNLKKTLKKEKIILTSDFTVILSKETNKIFLLDGHHRLQALKSLYMNDEIQNLNYIVRLYEMKNDEDPRIIELFEKINNTKPFKTNIEISRSSSNIFIKLKKTYPKVFKNTGIRSNFPYINEYKFTEKLKSILIRMDRIDDENILKEIYRINRLMGQDIEEKLINNNRTLRTRTKDIEKLEKINCYLGIDKKLNWLNNLL